MRRHLRISGRDRWAISRTVSLRGSSRGSDWGSSRGSCFETIPAHREMDRVECARGGSSPRADKGERGGVPTR